MVARREECQRCLAVLADEQEAFVQDVRAFAGAHGMIGKGVEARGTEQTEASSDGARAAPETQELASSSHEDQPPRPRESSQLEASHSLRSACATGSERSARLEHHSLLELPVRSEHPPQEERSSGSEHAVETQYEHLSDPVHSARRLSLERFQSQLSSLQDREAFDKRASGLVSRSRLAADMVLRSKVFEPAMGLVIFVNAVNIGLAIDRELRDKDTSTQENIENVLLLIFTVELVLRFHAQGIRCLQSSWNAVDALLISGTALIMLIRAVSAKTDNPNAMTELIDSLLLLRMLRLLRLVRAMRLVGGCGPLWKLVQGLKHSVSTMASAFLLLFMSIYLFACFGAELITKVYKDDAEVGPIVAEHYSSLPVIILTLCRFLSMDSTTTVYVPLALRSPVLAVYFSLLVLILSIALMNLITAVVVDDAIRTTQMDNEMKKHFLRAKLRDFRPAFKELFQGIDSASNGNGIVEVQEIIQAFKAGLEIPPAIQGLVNTGRLLDLFDLLDQDEDGGLTESEFVDGLSCLAISEAPLETMQILHVLRSIRHGVTLLTAGRGGLAATPSSSVHRRPTVLGERTAQPGTARPGAAPPGAAQPVLKDAAGLSAVATARRAPAPLDKQVSIEGTALCHAAQGHALSMSKFDI